MPSRMLLELDGVIWSVLGRESGSRFGHGCTKTHQISYTLGRNETWLLTAVASLPFLFND